MNKPGLVIVGASVAGIRTAEALRRRGHEGAITVLGGETHVPYDRPPLSKEYLLGKVTVDDLALTPPEAFAGLDVDLRLGVTATGLDVANREVHLGAERLPYETVVIATGSTPRALPAVTPLDGVHTFRTLDDADAIRGACLAGARVLVVGGGFIGAEIASSARLLGLDVTIVDPLPALMIRGLGPMVGDALARRHADNGVRLLLGHGVAALRGGSRVEEVVLDDGRRVAADVVVVGIGVTPAVGWLAGSGLDVSDGVACDAGLRVTDGVYAVGDAARWWCRGRHVRAEHWTNASDQAAAVAGAITGTPSEYHPLPYVWSDQLGQRLQVWGELAPDDEIRYFSGGEQADEFVAVAGRGGRLVGVAAFGARRDAMRAMRLLRAGTAWEQGFGPVEPAA